VTAVVEERPPADGFVEVFARRRRDGWTARAPAFGVVAEGASDVEAISSAIEAIRNRVAHQPPASSFENSDARRVAGFTLLFVLMARVLTDREYARIPLRELETDAETMAVLNDAHALADLEASDDDVARGDIVGIDDLKQQLERG